MKKTSFFRLLAMVALAISATCFAQTYPYTTPTYTPTAVLAPATYSAPADPTFIASGLSTVAVRVSGTCTALAATPQGSNDGGTNWSTVQLIPAAGGNLVTSISGTGMWRANVGGLNRFRLHITALSASCTVAMTGTAAPGAVYLMNPNSSTNPTSITDSTGTYNWAVSSAGSGSVVLSNGTTTAGFAAASTAAVAATPALVVAQSPNVIDPCASSMIAKSSAVIDQGASATTKVVDASSSKVIYVCGFVASAVGTSPTFTWTSGTHGSADCDTGAVVLSGAMNPSATVGVVSYSATGTVFKTAASAQLCLTTAGSTSVKGVLTYVQQ